MSQQHIQPFARASVAKTAASFLGLTRKSPGIHMPPCIDIQSYQNRLK